MNFLAPLWIPLLVAGLTAPVLLFLYFLKLRRQEIPVSSTLLWRQAIQDLQVNAPFQRGQGGEIVAGPGGRISVCWAGVIGASPWTEDFVGFATSTDGGTSWAVTENAYDINGIAGLLPQKGNIRVDGVPRMAIDNSTGPRRGWTYIVSTQRNLPPAGSDPDIIMRRSSDNGASWSPAIRVNQDPLNHGRIQYFPAIHVDASGGVNIIFYDDRTTTTDSATVFLARSTDGGDTWSEYPLSDHIFKPQPIGGLGQGYQGDNIGLTSVGDTLWPVWMDNVTGVYQVWTAPAAISGLTDVVEETGAPVDGAGIGQFPNPFNAGTSFSVRLTSAGPVRLSVVDLLGREVALLVDERRPAGVYTERWDAAGLPSGVYFSRLEAGGKVFVGKMALVR